LNGNAAPLFTNAPSEFALDASTTSSEAVFSRMVIFMVGLPGDVI